MVNRPLRDCILIDNLVYSYTAQPHNGVLIKPFLGQTEDEELAFLSEALGRWKPGVEAVAFIERELGQGEFLRFLRGGATAN